MVDFFDRLYANITDKNAFLTRIRFYSILRYMIRRSANWILPLYLKRSSSFGRKPAATGSRKILVSLTSFPERINKVWLTIETIMRQSVQPDEIVLWLSKEQFSSIDELPQSLKRQIPRGLKIEIREGDLKSHKKYYYAVKEFPDYILITVDDDIFYPSEMIADLIKTSQNFPDAIVCRYAYTITSREKDIALYNQWVSSPERDVPAKNIFFGSGGGTLFPSGAFPEVTLNKEIFLDICRYADDIWLNSMIRLQGWKVVRTGHPKNSILPVIIPGNKELFNINLIEERNDTQLRDVRKYLSNHFGVDPYRDLITWK